MLITLVIVPSLNPKYLGIFLSELFDLEYIEKTSSINFKNMSIQIKNGHPSKMEIHLKSNIKLEDLISRYQLLAYRYKFNSNYLLESNVLSLYDIDANKWIFS